MSDTEIIALLTEIRDLQRQQLELMHQSIANQTQSLATQQAAVARQQEQVAILAKSRRWLRIFLWTVLAVVVLYWVQPMLFLWLMRNR